MRIQDFRDAENQEMLLNFVINYCSPNHIEQTLEMIHQIRSDRENLDIGGSFIEFLSTPTNLLTTAVSSVSSTALRLSSVGSGTSLQDESENIQKSSSPEPEENMSLEDLILHDREEEVETRLKNMFDIAIEGLEDTSKFSTAMLCLQATNKSSEWIDQSASKKDELVLLLLCYYLASKESTSGSSSLLPVLETIFNAANDSGQLESEFKTVHQRLLDFVYGEELIEYGIDPDEFLSDEQYRIDSIAGLADTDDDSQLTLGWFSRISLAQHLVG